jgi:MFS family permease
VYTIVKASDYGWGATHTLGFGAGSLGLLAAFFARESRTSNPLIPLRIFRSRNVSATNLVQALMVGGLFGMFFLGSLYLERVLGYGAVEIGLAFLPVALAIGAFSLGLSARLNNRFGARATLIPGLALVFAGLAWFARAPVNGEYLTDLFPAMILLGVGAGLAFPSLMTLAMSSATQSDSGLASGLVNTTQQVGGALGLAVLATLSTTRTDNLLAAGEAVPDALTSGYQLAFIIATGLVVAAIGVAMAVLRAEPVPDELEEPVEELARAEPAYYEEAA